MKLSVRDVRTLFATLLALAVICGGVAAVRHCQQQ